jgi:hypothetical protein
VPVSFPCAYACVVLGGGLLERAEKNCEENPNCLHGLGYQKDGIWYLLGACSSLTPRRAAPRRAAPRALQRLTL